MPKYRLVRDRLVAERVLAPEELEESRLIDRASLLLAHTPESLDVALPDGCRDSEYIEVLERHLPGVLERSRPDILFFQAGVDPLEHDLLGRLMLSLDGLRARDGIIARAARQCGVPLVLTLGGGYARPISLSVDAHVATWRESRGVL